MTYLSDVVAPFRWHVYGGGRHAILRTLGKYELGQTLCGIPVTVPDSPPIFGWEPECPTCDSAWRRAIGVPTRDEVLAGSHQRVLSAWVPGCARE